MAPKWNAMTYYICNNGYAEHVHVRDYGLMQYDRIKWRELIKQAKQEEGVQLSQKVSLKVTSYSDGNCCTHFYPNCEQYEAELRYEETPFLITLGSGKDLSYSAAYEARSIAEKYKVPVLVPPKAPGPMVVDIILPTTCTEGLAFLYSGDCRKFTQTLGRALLFPETLRI